MDCCKSASECHYEARIRADALGTAKVTGMRKCNSGPMYRVRDWGKAGPIYGNQCYGVMCTFPDANTVFGARVQINARACSKKVGAFFENVGAFSKNVGAFLKNDLIIIGRSETPLRPDRDFSTWICVPGVVISSTRRS